MSGRLCPASRLPHCTAPSGAAAGALPARQPQCFGEWQGPRGTRGAAGFARSLRIPGFSAAPRTHPGNDSAWLLCCPRFLSTFRTRRLSWILLYIITINILRKWWALGKNKMGNSHYAPIIKPRDPLFVPPCWIEKNSRGTTDVQELLLHFLDSLPHNDHFHWCCNSARWQLLSRSSSSDHFLFQSEIKEFYA